jgi:hypothetical protein
MGALFYEPAALTAELWALEELIIVLSERTRVPKPERVSPVQDCRHNNIGIRNCQQFRTDY